MIQNQLLFFIISFCFFGCITEEITNTPQNLSTKVVEVKSKTGRIWMDRNLGASEAATSSSDIQSFGNLYQWGRGSDGHQLRTSGTTTILSKNDVPLNKNFIIATNNPFDWRNPPNNNLWFGLNGINNPCPSGFRIPTKEEFLAEAAYWGNLNSGESAFNSPLKLPLPGYRASNNALIKNAGSLGFY